MTEDDVRALIRKRSARMVKVRGEGVTEWGRRHGVNRGHLSQFMNGQRGPDTDVLDALNLEWRICRKTRNRAASEASS